MTEYNGVFNKNLSSVKIGGRGYALKRLHERGTATREKLKSAFTSS